jgi:hypothetical protein
MALSSKEQFRMGFLLRCAEEGIGADEIKGRVKMAFINPAKIPGAALNALKLWAGIPLRIGALGLGGAALAGSAGGYGLAKATEEEIDPAEAKRQELIATYQQQADKARRAMSRQRYRGQAPAAPKLFQ